MLLDGGRDERLIRDRPLVSGWENINRLVRPDLIPGFLKMFQDGKSYHTQVRVLIHADLQDRHARAEGKEPGMVSVVTDDPMQPAALPTPDSHVFFSEWEKKSDWKNEVTLKRSVYASRATDVALTDCEVSTCSGRMSQPSIFTASGLHLS